MSRLKYAIIIILFGLLLGGIFAESITLSDGQVIEGEILHMDEEMIKVKLYDGNIFSISRKEVMGVDYQENTPHKELSVEKIPLTAPVTATPVSPSVVPFETYPPVSYPIDIYAGTGLLDPELEARKRIIKFNERKKNPFLASTLGFVFPGCGHFYSEKIGEGFFFLGSRTLFGTLIWYGFKTRIDAQTEQPVYNDIVVGSVGAVGFTAVTIFEMIDAYYASEAFNDNLKLKLGIETLHDDVIPLFGE